MSSLSGSAPTLSVRDPSLTEFIVFLNKYLNTSYTNIAFLAVLVYDHAITADIEVARIWTLQWGLPKILFLINRYIVPPMLIFNEISFAIPNIPGPICAFIIKWTAWPTVVALATVEMILMLRVLAIYGHSKMMTRFLVGLFIIQMVVLLVMTSVVVSNIVAIPGDPILAAFFSPHYIYMLAGFPQSFLKVSLSSSLCTRFSKVMASVRP